MIIDGRSIAKKILDEIKKESLEFKKRPALATILIGDNEASKIYISSKKKISQKLNFKFKNYHFDIARFSRYVLEKKNLKLIDKLNQDKNICGFLLQFPLPRYLDADYLVQSIHPYKDIDGFHAQNIQKFLKIKDFRTIDLIDKKRKRNFLMPVTPTAVIEIIKASKIKLEKQKVVVAGKKSIFLTPLIHFFKINRLSLMQVYPENNINTRRTLSSSNFFSKIKLADILITALGRAKFIKKDMIKPGVFIIDVGINRLNGKVVGDVDFDKVEPLCSYITPVAGGVGPVTIAVLMSNVLKAYQLNEHISKKQSFLLN